MGRLDRYGTGNAIRSFVLCCLDDPFERAWTACLSEGFGVFNRSIASLQYLVETEMQRLRTLLLTESKEAITTMTVRLGGLDGDVIRELRRINRQDALDALATPPKDSLDVLLTVDGDWKTFQKRVNDWLINCLQMVCRPGPDVGRLPSGDQVVRFGLKFSDVYRTLIPLDRFIATTLPALDLTAPGASARKPLTYPYTCRRQTVLNRLCRSHGVRLLRLGDMLLDGLQKITSLDDRGRCFAMWRSLSDYQQTDTVDIFLRFDFVVEVETAQAVALYLASVPEAKRTVKTALKRRGDMMFPPFFHRLWIDHDFQPVLDPAMLARLDAPYAPDKTLDGRQDANLNYQRLESLRGLKLPILDVWRDFISQARLAAEQLLYLQQEITDRGKMAVTKARTTDANRFAQLRMRIQHGEGHSVNDDRRRLDLEEHVAVALYEGMLKPHISLDTIGAVFLANLPFDAVVRCASPSETE